MTTKMTRRLTLNDNSRYARLIWQIPDALVDRKGINLVQEMGRGVGECEKLTWSAQWQNIHNARGRGLGFSSSKVLRIAANKYTTRHSVLTPPARCFRSFSMMSFVMARQS